MEAVAAIASVAGILSLVGQTLDGIIKLREFFKGYSQAFASVRFLRALNGLIRIHENVRDLITRLKGTAAAEANKNVLASLQIQVDDCRKDVGFWLEKASDCQPVAGSGVRARFKKFLVALEKEKTLDLYQEISDHRDNITTQLSIIGRHLDISQSAVLEKISTKMDRVAETRILTTEAFERSEANHYSYYGSDTYNINSGPASLASIASSLNRIESVLGSQHESFGSDHSFGSVHIFNDFQPTPPMEDNPRDDPLYKNAIVNADGLYHCPWEGNPSCSHKPEKLKCNYDKFVDAHVKPYRCKVTTCENARFSSTACLLRHEREAHGMHGHGEKPFHCTYEGCDRAIPGNGFPRHWNLSDHMRRVHNLSKPPESSSPRFSSQHKKRKADGNTDTYTAKDISFVEFSTSIAENRGSCLSSHVSDYLHLLRLRSMMKTWIEGIGAMPWLFSEKTEGKDKDQDDGLRTQIQRLQSDIDRVRGACWAAGENVDDIDILLKIRDEYSTSTPWEPLQKEIMEQEDMLPVLQGCLEGGTRLAASLQDRINLWLLENLRASPNEAAYLRSYLGINAYVDNQDWARAVLKYWLLDEAAAGQREQATSTNGAVNSAGMCHSARVVLENHLPFPTIKTKREVLPVESVSGTLPRETLFLDDADEMSQTARHSARSLSHRQKRRKGEKNWNC